MATFEQYYSMLNSEQKEVVELLDGPVLVLAGPGTGKTELLSIRAANIIMTKRAAPENILVLTFTNAAARAMRERLAKIIGQKGYDVEVETFHSFANSIVLESEEAIDHVKDKVELSDVERVRALRYILDNVKGAAALRPFGSPYIHLSEIGTRISELKKEGIKPREFKESLKSIKPDDINLEEKHIARLAALGEIYERYEKLKDEDARIVFDARGRIDYDDMILIALETLGREKDLKDRLMRHYRYVMVDEYQDTNGVQLELLFSLLDKGKPNLCCVGDDDQSIFRFQGATLSNFRKLEEKLPALKKVTLKKNYRSSGEILDLSGKIISQVPPSERVADKKLESERNYEKRAIRNVEFLTEEEELSFIINEINRQVKSVKSDKSLKPEEREKPYNNIAVLVRKREQILRVINAFLEAGIPYATDGEEDIRQEKRVRQMMDVLELANPELAGSERKSLILYRILTSDYIQAEHSDIIKFIGFVNKMRADARVSSSRGMPACDMFQQFIEHFGILKKDKNGEYVKPFIQESKELDISGQLGLVNPHALHHAAWAVLRLLKDSGTRPVHDMVMGYVEDVGLYKFLVERYEKDKVLRIRDLRALVSFINMIKKSDVSNPAMRINDFQDELELRDMHGMPVQGELATLSQEGVRIYTVHKSKGLEFYTVFMPFCLHLKSWPLRGKSDAIPLPPDIYKSKERVDEKEKLKLLDLYDELRLFYVASTRAKAHLIYTAAPAEKVVASPFLEHLGIDPEKGSPGDEESFLAEYLEKRPAADDLSSTKDVLKDMVSQLSLNPTSLNNYIGCRRKFFYNDVLKLPGRKNQHLTFGNCVHKALENVYSEYKEKKRFPSFTAFKKYFMDELEFQGVSESIRNGCVDKLETLKAWYENKSESPIIPFDLENKLEITMPDGIVFRGAFDKIEEEGKGEIRVIDYKTGKPDRHIKALSNCRDLSNPECDEYLRQLVSYKLLYEKNMATKRSGEVVVKGVLEFIEPVSESVKKYNMTKGEYRSEVVSLTREMVSELEAVIKKCWRDIQSLKFDKLEEEDDKMCGKCEYSSICWEK